MANTTNFGWETPDDTDLVKDGAAAMRTLGNAIDASLVDLKGGTTNQILAKNSNTDMDFKWVANDVGDITAVTAGTGLSGGGTSGDVTLTNTVATTFDAKGDLVVGTGADTFAKLVAGSNGETLVADSSTTTGLRWQGNYAAGNNLVINGNMNIAQRGTSLTSLSTGETYLIDRFAFRNNNLGTATYSQETDAPAGFRTSARVLFTTADNTPAASDFSYFRYKFEGQQLQALQKGSATARPTTLSFWVKSNVTGNYVVNFVDLDNTRLICGSYTINSSATWEKKTITIPGDTTGALDNDNVTSFLLDFALGAGTDRTSGTLQTTWGATVNANAQVGQVNVAATVNNYWMITGIQWEIGSVATEFNLAAGNGNIAGELAACQRYYQRYGGQAAYQVLGTGMTNTTTNVYGLFSLPVPMRVIPTSVDFSTLVYQQSEGGLFAISSAAFNSPGLQCVRLDLGITGGTANRPGQILTNNSTSAYVGFSAEL